MSSSYHLNLKIMKNTTLNKILFTIIILSTLALTLAFVEGEGGLNIFAAVIITLVVGFISTPMLFD